MKKDTQDVLRFLLTIGLATFAFLVLMLAYNRAGAEDKVPGEQTGYVDTDGDRICVYRSIDDGLLYEAHWWTQDKDCPATLQEIRKEVGYADNDYVQGQ